MNKIFLVKTCKPSFRTVKIDGYPSRLPFPYTTFMCKLHHDELRVSSVYVYFSATMPEESDFEKPSDKFFPMPLPNVETYYPLVCMGSGFERLTIKGKSDDLFEKLMDDAIAFFWSSEFDSDEMKGCTLLFQFGSHRHFFEQWFAGNQTTELNLYPENLKTKKTPNQLLDRSIVDRVVFIKPKGNNGEVQK